MSDINKLSERVIEYAERASAMADAAQGKKRIRSTGLAWLVLPAAGAGLYAMARSKSVTRQAKGAVAEVKTRATELPDDLLGLVRQSSQPARTTGSSNGTTRQGQRRSGSTRRKSTTRTKSTPRTKTTS